MNSDARTPFRGRADIRGFSITELLVVVLLIGIICAISIPMLLSSRKLYRSEEQSLKILDLMGEASQRALNQRRTFRFEIDLTDNSILLIREEAPNPDVLLKRIPMDETRNVRMDVKPTGVNAPIPPNFPDAVFAADARGHLDGTTPVTGHNVFAARFQPNGTVLNSAGNPLVSTFYVWAPIAPNSSVRNSNGETKAVTIYGTSGVVRYWKFNGTTFIESR